MKVKAVLFDMDGTLIDSMKQILKSVNISFKYIGLPEVSAETLGEIAGRPLTEILKMFNANIDVNSLKRCEEIFQKTYQEMSAVETHPFPKVEETLKRLHSKGISLAVVSTTLEKFIHQELERFGFEKYFDAIIGRDSVQNYKPSPEGILKALSQLGVKPDECVYVGDSPLDIKAGRTAKVKTIAVATGLSKRETLEKEKPDFIINEISEILNIIDD